MVPLSVHGWEHHRTKPLRELRWERSIEGTVENVKWLAPERKFSLFETPNNGPVHMPGRRLSLAEQRGDPLGDGVLPAEDYEAVLLPGVSFRVHPF